MSNIDAKRWRSMCLMEQFANIGSEVGRTAKWVGKQKPDFAGPAFIRALEIIDLTISYGREHSPGRYALLEELCRAREYFCGSYSAHSIDDLKYLEKYFGQFASAFNAKKRK